ncbi:MAG: hypothetical protein AVDCRST_MAG50-1084 [uncultured Acidimicrobiales bacterium]|uniref:Uncharacterized protein n=1 Tax=uncultured Acidimicrobiales bacterium TaxID=310071 RepID=A0A6J4HT58_9ACTN|nr:MAG: hypothetical protein AVDCRST_MAG50-1084 [uncultured Acidimicrobiales bacterium]
MSQDAGDPSAAVSPVGDRGLGGVSAEAARAVFARAAEIESARQEERGFDLEVLTEIGREAGLSEAAVRLALAEQRAGFLDRSAADPTDPRAVEERVVRGEAGEVAAAADRFLEGQQLTRTRAAGHSTVWAPREGREAGRARAQQRRQGKGQLSRVSNVRATVVDLGDGTCLVRLDAGLSHVVDRAAAARRRAVLRGAGAGAVSIVGAVAAASDNGFSGLEPLLLAGVPIGGMYVRSRFSQGRARKVASVARIENALAGFCDSLDRDRPAPALEPGRPPDP